MEPMDWRAQLRELLAQDRPWSTGDLAAELGVNHHTLRGYMRANGLRIPQWQGQGNTPRYVLTTRRARLRELLVASRYWTVAALAAELGVNQRTIKRDLRVMGVQLVALRKGSVTARTALLSGDTTPALPHPAALV